MTRWLTANVVGALLWLSAHTALAAQPEKTLCFFSLNNALEYHLTTDFLEQAERAGYGKVRTLEFHNPDSDSVPESSFDAMLESRPPCDGLVISGHHTGSFGGNRARGVLDIGFLEERSCDPAHRDFFSGVKAVWLQGCRTLGVGPIAPEAGAGEELLADYHMQRVGAELMNNGMQQSFAELSIAFSSTLDPDNPLASRYARVFPEANLFGWTRSSPGVKAGSEKSLLYHMAHMTRSRGEGPPFNPLLEQSPDLRSGMTRDLQQLLAGGAYGGAVARQAWLDHGHVKRSGVGFDNPYLNAYPPLRGSARDDLVRAGAHGCDLRNAQDLRTLQQALDTVLADRTDVAYNLNVIRDVFDGRAGSNAAEYEALRRQLADSAALMGLLEEKLRSPRTGLLMKIEYYDFFRSLTAADDPETEARILGQARHFLLARNLAGSAYDVRDFRESLLVSVARHRLADTAFYQGVIRDPEVREDTLYALAYAFLQESPPEARELFREIAAHPRGGTDTLRVAAIWALENSAQGQRELVRVIVQHPKVDSAALATAASVLARGKTAADAELIEAIVLHPEADSSALSQAALAIGKHDIGIAPSLVDSMLRHPSLDRWGLRHLAQAVGQNPDLGGSASLTRIVDHAQVDSKALNSVAIALGGDGIEPSPELLRALANHPRADSTTSAYVELARTRNQSTGDEEEFF
jgi:hypothetical protein